MDKARTKSIFFWGLLILIILLVLIFIFLGMHKKLNYALSTNLEEGATTGNIAKEDTPAVPTEPVIVPTHIKTPKIVEALYMSSWVAGTPSLRTKLISTIETTDTNALVIDIKDATGKISFLSNNATLHAFGSEENRIPNIVSVINNLHAKGIYVIGRIAVFQDPYMTVKKPEWSIKKKSDGTIWKDKKGLSFLDPTNTEVWNYIDHIATASYDVGFDEINFDYIRFPSDGNISDISYPTGEGKTRADAIKAFWEHTHATLKKDRPEAIMSADLFGLVTTQTDDMGIGQILENAFPNFDYIAPMIYPSHYPKNWNGYSNPADHPYEVIKKAMADGLARATAAGYPATIFRPWIQDFSLGATYTKEMVVAQIKALKELGIDSYMSWDPRNEYTDAAYLGTGTLITPKTEVSYAQ